MDEITDSTRLKRFYKRKIEQDNLPLFEKRKRLKQCIKQTSNVLSMLKNELSETDGDHQEVVDSNRILKEMHQLFHEIEQAKLKHTSSIHLVFPKCKFPILSDLLLGQAKAIDAVAGVLIGYLNITHNDMFDAHSVIKPYQTKEMFKCRELLDKNNALIVDSFFDLRYRARSESLSIHSHRNGDYRLEIDNDDDYQCLSIDPKNKPDKDDVVLSATYRDWFGALDINKYISNEKCSGDYENLCVKAKVTIPKEELMVVKISANAAQ
jgi:hypothetical protein